MDVFRPFEVSSQVIDAARENGRFVALISKWNEIIMVALSLGKSGL